MSHVVVGATFCLRTPDGCEAAEEFQSGQDARVGAVPSGVILVRSRRFGTVVGRISFHNGTSRSSLSFHLKGHGGLVVLINAHPRGLNIILSNCVGEAKVPFCHIVDRQFLIPS